MLFNSYEFLFLFLPLVLLFYYVLLPKSMRHGILTVSSYLFYGWWDYRFCGLLLLSTVVDYTVGKRIALSSVPRARKGWLAVSMITNLSLLGFFKYFDLFAETINLLGTGYLGLDNPFIPLLNLVLPVGISFYTFQSMSYSLDIYYGSAKPADRFWDFACYVALFPQLIAGPIIRYHELADQLRERSHTVQKAAKGITFFILGLAKKVIIADGVALLVPMAFGTPEPGLVASWVGVLAYTMQIYYDFSGYSDMAVGLGYMFGFKFPQNFNSPYQSISITDFWRRWHMSLSRWLRDYLYIPLGGNRKGTSRTYINLCITMLLGGFWHGANWTFVLWGAFHGVLLGAERVAGKRGLFSFLPRVFQQGMTFILIMLGWVIFRCESLSQAGNIYAGLAGAHGLGRDAIDAILWSPLPAWMLLAACLLTWCSRNTWEVNWRPGVLLAIGLIVVLGVCIITLLLNTSSPFLYFQF